MTSTTNANQMTPYERHDISLKPKDVTDRRVRLAVTSTLWCNLRDAAEGTDISVTQPTDSLHLLQHGLMDKTSATVQRELAFAAWDILTVIRMEYNIPADKPLKVVFVPHIPAVYVHIDSDLPIYSTVWK